MKTFCKGYYLFKKIITVTVGILFLLIGCGTIYNMSQINIGDAIHQPIMLTTGIFVTLLSFLFIIISFRFINRFDQKKSVQIIIACVLFTIMTGIFLVLLLTFDVRPLTDSFTDIDEAMYLLTHPTVTRDNIHGTMKLFGNNYFFVVCLKYLFKLFKAVGMSDFLFPLFTLNAAAIVFSVFLTWQFIKECRGIAAANKTLLLCVMNPVYYGLAFWAYTCTFSLPIMMGILYVAFRIYRTNNFFRELLLTVIEGMLVALGYEIRPTAVFPFIAAVMIAVVFLIRYKLYKRILRISLIVLFTVCMTSSFISNIKSIHFSEISDLNWPVTYWLMMGSHGNGDLTTSAEDVEFVNSYKTYEEKNKYCFEKTCENYKELGLSGTINLWLRKMITTWSDGYSIKNVAGETETYLYQLIWGDHSQIYQIYSQAFRLITAIGIVVLCFCLIRKDEIQGNLFAAILTVFGGVIFHMMWEAKNVYSAPFILLMLTLTQNGISSLESDARIEKWYGNCRKMMAGVYFSFVVIIGLSLCFIFRQEVKVNYYRIYALKNRWMNEIIVSEDEGSIIQDFYVCKPFNRIILLAGIDKNSQDISDYEIFLTDSRKNVLYRENITKDKVKNGKVNLKVPSINDDNHYYIVIKKANKTSGNILFYTKKNYGLDSYKGSLIVDGKDGFVNDLMMNVCYSADEQFFGKRKRYLIMGGFVLLSILVYIGFHIMVDSSLKQK